MNARALTSALALAAVLACDAHAQTPVVQAYQELFAASQKEKRGLTFHVRGQTIGGAVVRVMVTMPSRFATSSPAASSSASTASTPSR